MNNIYTIYTFIYKYAKIYKSKLHRPKYYNEHICKQLNGSKCTIIKRLNYIWLQGTKQETH